MLWLIIAGLTVVALLAVVAEALTAAGWAGGVAVVEQLDIAAPGTAEGDELYEGRHRAPDAEAVTVQIERAAYWPPAVESIARPYVTAGGTR